jgi:phasin protein
MAAKERTTAPAKSPAPNLGVEDFAQIGQKQAAAMIDMQKALISTFEKMNREWFAGAQGLARSATPDLVPDHPSEAAQRPAAALIDVQKELVGNFESLNREWAARVKAEMDLAAAYAARFAAARSIPDVVTVCQEWNAKRMEMAFDDGRRLVADSQKLMAASARYLSGGWTSSSM